MGARVNDLFPTTAWRFLLPDPVPELICQVGDTAPMFPDSFEHTDSSLGSADLVVSGSPDPVTLAKMFLAARPGGSCYVETSQKRWTNPAAVARRISDAGFTGVRLYSLSQTPDRTQVSWWMPLGQRSIRQHLLSRQARGGSRSRRVFSRSLKAANSAFPSLLDRAPWLISPKDCWRLCAIAVKPGRDGATPVTSPGIVRTELGPDMGSVNCLMALGGSSSDHPIIYPFTDFDPEPRAVIKIPMLGIEVADARSEVENLAALASYPALSALVPAVIATESTEEFFAVSQSYLSGPPISRVVADESIEEIAAAVVEQLVNLSRATSRLAPVSWLEGVINQALAEAEGTLSPAGGSAVALTRKNLAALKLDTQACQHRDLGPWNINRDETGSVGFIDWSEAHLNGIPVCDAVHFLTHLVLIVDDGYAPSNRDDVLASCVDRNHARGRLIDQCLVSYMDQLGLDPKLRNEFRLLTWVLATIKRPAAERPGSLYEQLWLLQLRRNARH